MFPETGVTITRLVAEGDLVSVHARFRAPPADPGTVIVDVYRVQNKKIVEHWDVVQAVPANSANDNTMF
ncbi:nuclear transport factor 2 family protein [Streptomyces sp. NPDC020898]|uniref:nuclear transport factor 2 family protein n=1 Tax=Streptomyces sp. NPDC020898 TaxID=3365101 RepID=UPI00379C7EAB